MTSVIILVCGFVNMFFSKTLAEGGDMKMAKVAKVISIVCFVSGGVFTIGDILIMVLR